MLFVASNYILMFPHSVTQSLPSFEGNSQTYFILHIFVDEFLLKRIMVVKKENFPIL